MVVWLAVNNVPQFRQKLGNKVIRYTAECQEVNWRASKTSESLGRTSYSYGFTPAEEIPLSQFQDLSSWEFIVTVEFEENDRASSAFNQLLEIFSNNNRNKRNPNLPEIKPEALGFDTTKYKDELLVHGYIRMETDNLEINVSADLLILFHKWYHAEFNWNPDKASTKLQIQGDTVQLTQSDAEFHSILMSPCIMKNDTS